MSNSALINQTFDDRNTVFKYLGFWFLTGSWNASNVGDSGTLSSTSDLEANVTFTFPTPAVAFYYYGIPRCCGGFYGICIDCDPNNPNFIPIDAVNTTDDGKNPPILLFSMTFNTPGVHEIIIRNQNDTRFGKSQLTLDRIDLEVADTTGTPTTQSTSSTRTISPTATQTTSAASTSPPIGAIVGGALGGGAVLICLALFAFWFYLRRKRAASAEHERPQSFPAHTSIMTQEPYTLPSTATTSSPSMQQASSTSTNPTTMNSHPQTRYGQGMGKRRHAAWPSTSTFPDGSSVSFSTSQPSLVPRRALDGGPLPLEEDEEEPTLPPEYGQVFSDRRMSSRNSQSRRGGTTSSSSGRGDEENSIARPTSISPVRRKF